MTRKADQAFEIAAGAGMVGGAMDSEPSIRLVVNADGFGATPDITEGILRAHREGIVTSTSVHGTAPLGPADLSAALAEAPELGVGLHAVLVGGRPLSPPDAIPSLITAEGMFPDSAREFLRRWAKGEISQRHLEREILAQAQRLHDAGLRLDHMNSYLNLGFLPQVAQALETVAARLGIATLRTEVEQPNLAWFTDIEQGLPLAALRGMSWFVHRRLGARRHGPQSWGYVDSGDLGKMRILEILGRMRPGIHELICHPGTHDDRERVLSGRWHTFHRSQELDALTAPLIREAVARRGIVLCRFSDLF